MINYPYKIVDRVDVLPISLSVAKEFLHIDSANTSHDSAIESMLKAVRDFFEAAANISTTEITWITYRYNFENSYQIRRRPVNSIESIKYYDTDSVLQTVSSSDYLILPYLPYDYILFKNAFSAPEISDDDGWPIEITFKTGYGNTADVIPDDMADGLLAHLAKIFENRGDAYEFSALAGNVRRYVPRTTKLAINKYRVMETGQ